MAMNGTGRALGGGPFQNTKIISSQDGNVAGPVLIGLGVAGVATVGAGMMCGYTANEVKSNETGARIHGGEITKIVGEGSYSKWFGFNTYLFTYKTDPVTFHVKDTEVITKENQPVGVELDIKVRRPRPGEEEIAKRFLRENRTLAKDDAEIAKLLGGVARQTLKVEVREMSLAQVLDDRDKLRTEIFKALHERAQQYNLILVSVDVQDVNPDPAYMAELKNRALYGEQKKTQTAQQELIEAKKATTLSQIGADKETQIAHLQAQNLVLEKQMDTEHRHAELREIRGQHLTPALLRALVIEKWDGKGPVVAGDGNAVINLKDIMAPAAKSGTPGAGE